MRTDRLQIIQYLRGIAAMMVVVHHAKDGLDQAFFNPLHAFTGSGAGVDIFFVVSGVVMYAAARNESAREFIRRRIIRIVPLYWLATTVYLFVLLRHIGIGDLAADYIKSLLFIPYGVFPLLIPGWTLNYEMFFYVIFAIAILSRRLIPCLTSIVLLLIITGALCQFRQPVLLTYTNPLLLNFLSGVLMASLLARSWPRSIALLLPLGFALILAVDLLPVPGFNLRTGSFGAILVVAGALAIERNGYTPTLPFLSRMGDASYSIYLSHVFTLMAVQKIAGRVPLTGWFQFGVYMACAVVACAMVGELTYRWIEQPLSRAAKRIWPRTDVVSR